MSNSKIYQHRATFTDASGRKHDIRAHSKTELLEKLAKAKQDADAGVKPLQSSTITVREWADTCFSMYKQDADANTLYIQRNCFDRHVNDIIGHLRVKDVSPLHCQQTINECAGLADYTVRRVAQLMRFVFDKAVANNIIRHNPCDGMVLPKGGKQKRRALTAHEQKLVFQTAELNPQYSFFLVMMCCGLRNSEVAALRGIDLKQINGEWFLHVNGSKTENARRDVPCPDYLRERLPQVSPFDYLFHNQRGGQMNRPNYERLWKHFKRDMNIQAGCRVYRNQLVPPYPVADDLCSYMLRHTYCSNLIMRGVNINVVKTLMGHSTIAITSDIYTHIDDGAIVEVAREINHDERAKQGLAVAI